MNRIPLIIYIILKKKNTVQYDGSVEQVEIKFRKKG